MAYTRTPTASAQQEANWLLSSSAWDIWSPSWVLAPGVLTYSLPSSSAAYGKGGGSGFQAFSTAEKVAFYKIFDNLEAITKVDFVEIKANGSYGDIEGSYGFTNTPSTEGAAVIRLAKNAKAGTDASYAYLPSEKADGGDAWFGNKLGTFNGAAQVGTYAFTVLMHEIGHTLGLEHTFDNGPFGVVPADRNTLEYTVMSYSSYVGAPDWLNGAKDFPQTYMMLDLASLQWLYGADFAANAGDTVYTWDKTGTATEGAMRVNGTIAVDAPGTDTIFLTVWDGGGTDTYDASNFAGEVKINLQSGQWTTLATSQLADLDRNATGLQAPAGNVANSLLVSGVDANGNATNNLIENAIGGTGADTLTGNQAGNRLTGGLGLDTLAGGEGADTFVYLVAADSSGSSGDVIIDFDGLDFVDIEKVDADRTTAGDQDFVWHAEMTSYASLGIGEMGFVPNANDAGGTLLARIDADASIDFQVNIRFREPVNFAEADIYQAVLLV